jgi:HEPN domain-containing protein/predicted nucleotidyltransferase
MDDGLLRRIHDALTHAELSFTVEGALVFGSRVSGKATPSACGGDVDLLVVAEDIHPKLHRRGGEICNVKRILSPLPVDVLLLTRKEVISNFNNHNPLFLDIAEEGEIILDTESFLETLIAATRTYVRQRGIQRTEGGWVFPVRAGAPSLLSKVSNKDFSLAMLTDGGRDFTIGKRLSSDGFFDKAVYQFQQAVEKSIKSVLIAIGVFERTHFVGEVLRKYANIGTIPEKWRNDILEIADLSSGMEPDVSLSRYPGIIEDTLWLPFEEYEPEDALKAMEKAEKVLSVAKRFIGDWFPAG